jgi:hypothetical protein
MTPVQSQWVGKAFINPVADYLLIGSVWSIAITALLLMNPGLYAQIDTLTLLTLVVLINSAHFAASTLRLYSQPANYTNHPFLTLGLPLVALAVLAICLTLPGLFGRHLQALYLTWSPYHYAAQTFGLTLMYCHRSGVRIDPLDRRMLYWICLLPFLRAFLGAPNSGLGWFISRQQLEQIPLAFEVLGWTTGILTWLTFLLPVALLLRFVFVKRSGFPLIGVSMMVANGAWWIFLDFVNAFIIATIAHGLQYMAIVLIYHVREQSRQPGNERSVAYIAGTFYLKCLALGYGLFYCWPYALVLLGAGYAQSMLMVIATINLHHFIVDRYIWRLRKPETQKVTGSSARVPIST